ncbi:MAG: hypothetical protein ABI550_01735, partial [Ignavibacteriaceae bacterium]
MLKRISSFIFLVILSSSQIFSGAWTQKKNSGFYKIDFRFLSADKFYDADGNKINLSGKFKDQTLSFYGEFGFTDFLTVTASFPFYKSISAKQDDNFVIEKLVKANNQLQNSEEKLSGIGDIKIGLKLRLAQIDKTIISCGVSLGLP